MTIERKVGMGIAGQPSGGPTDVAEVFSTGLHIGNATNTAITNGIDLAGEGGMVWVKSRTLGENHAIFDTERQGANWYLSSDNASAENQDTGNPMMVSFNSDGYTLGVNNFTNGYDPYVAWTFRKKEKFFDIVTWTGDGNASQTISHNLGCAVGVIMTKLVSGSLGTTGWSVYHRSANYANRTGAYTTTSAGQNFYTLNSVTSVNNNSGAWNNTDATDSVFTVGSNNNILNNTYVGYVYADNSAEDAEEQMIKCGNYTGNASATGPVVNLGWEPQFVLIKNVANNTNWMMFDSMRGVATEGVDEYLYPNSAGSYATLKSGRGDEDWIDFTATGFKININHINVNNTADDGGHIYMAIRAPMMIEPEAATDVFNIDTAGANGDGVAPNYRSTFPVDFALHVRTGSGGPQAYSRLTGIKYLYTDSTNDEGETTASTWDFMNGWYNQTSSQSINTGMVAHMWKRAKGFFDVVAWNQPNDTANTLVNHSLGVAPEMIWTKCRDAARGWVVYYGSSTHFLQLNQHYAHDTQQPHNTINETSFKVNGSLSGEIGGNNNYISYLFATLAGISKVGSYTGNGSSQTISCGFSAGSRFILIKRVDVASAYEGWWLWDATRGIVAGNDPHKRLNHNGSQVDTVDSVDPANAGFIVNQNSTTNINVSSGTYIFYAIA